MSSSDNFNEFENAIETSELRGHSKNSILLAFSKLFERASYYGIRAILILYASTNDTFVFETSDLIFLFGFFTGSVTLAQILGGIVGDLWLVNKRTALMGGLMQLVGAVLLCFPYIQMFYLGIGLVGVGTGFHYSNFNALYGKSYLKRLKSLDSGFVLLHGFVNLGSFVGIMMLSYLSEKWSFTAGFICAGVMSIFSVLLLFLSKQRDLKNIVLPKLKLSTRFLKISMILLFFIGFWLGHQLLSPDLFYVTDEISKSVETGILSGASINSLNSLFVALSAILLFIFWTFFHWNRYLKMGLGLVLGLTSFALILNVSPDLTESDLVIFVVSIALLGMAEVLITPTLSSAVVRYVSPKYFAIVFGLLFIPSRLTAVFSRLFENENGEFTEWSLDFGIGLFIVLSALGFLYSFIDHKYVKN